MSILDKLIKKYTGNSKADREILEYNTKKLFMSIDSLQKSDARLRQDIREIVREEIKYVLDHRARRTWV